eukprot:jgi/Phyca11/16272/fgenesh1_pg.PHYCAscaffold_19_\
MSVPRLVHNTAVPRLVHFFENRVVPRDIQSCSTVTGRIDVQALIAKYDAWVPFADDQDQPHAAPATSATSSDGMDVRSLIAKFSAWSPLADDQDQPARSLQPSARQHHVPVQTEYATRTTAAPSMATVPAATEVKTSNVPDILAVENPVTPKREVVASDKNPALLQAVIAIKQPVPTAIRIPSAIRIPTTKCIPTAIRTPIVTRIPAAAPIVAATLPPTTPAETPDTAAPQHPSARSCRLKTVTSRLFSYENDPSYLVLWRSAQWLEARSPLH